ncbi:MAG: 2Fe-2S iron-sulfur cluster binding domain-containing protein [Chromatiales bacterium]|nr:2Fe-2S iron-sulfur cluster binding domain-containing protein [Chromatiales bacterium]
MSETASAAACIDCPTVTIQPTGRTFEAAPTDSFLDAGLRAGLNLRYGCANGTCGDCRARVIAGQTRDIGHHDYPLSEVEKANGTVLMCSTAPLGDCTIEAVELHSHTDIAVQTIEARVSRIDRLGDRLILLGLRTPRSKTLRFLAGQQVDVKLRDLGPRRKAVASCPCNGMNLQIHVRKIDNDPFTELVFGNLKRGEAVTITGPYGSFTLDESFRRPLVFIVFETGFAPVQSLVEHAIALECAQPIDLYWASAVRDGQYLRNHVRAWADALDDFRYTEVNLSSEAQFDLRAAIDEIFDGYADAASRDFYITVPKSLRERIDADLRARNIPPEQLHLYTLERF